MCWQMVQCQLDELIWEELLQVAAVIIIMIPLDIVGHLLAARILSVFILKKSL